MENQENQMSESDHLDMLKMLVGVSSDDADQDTKLNWILKTAKSRLKFLLGGLEPPEEMSYIPVEVSVVRFNRISSEGMSVNNVEGENQQFHDSDFQSYMREIQAYLDTVNAEKRRGGFRFL